MSNRRAELALVGLLLVGCVGAIVFVFVTMTGSGGKFTPAERLPAAARDEPDRKAAAGAPESKPEAPAEKPDPGPGEPVPEPKPEEKPKPEEEPHDDPQASAELILELLVPATDPERLVLVVVNDEDGDPIEDALVVFRRGAALLYRERTDSEGEAGFMPLATELGPFRVDAIADGFAPATSHAVATGATTELALKARPQIEGVVVAPSKGSGVVKLFTSDATLTTTINNDGTFFFGDLDEGYVTVQAEVPPFGADSYSFDLEGGTLRFVKLRIRKNSRLRIYGRIQHWSGKGTVWINGIKVGVSATGFYQFDKAVVGVNEIRVDAPGKALVRERFDVKSMTKSRYDFSLKREGKIKGRVRDKRTGQAVPNAVVRLGVEFDNPRNDRVPLFPIDLVPVVRTDHEGRFTVTRLDKRLIYLLSVVAPGRGQALVEGVVPDGGHRTVMLPQGPFVYGRLSGLGGVPKDATVTALRLEETPSSRRFNVHDYDGSRSGRDTKGFFGLSGMLPGTYLVRVVAERFGTLETVIDMTESRRMRVDLRMRRNQNTEDADAHLLRRLPPVISTDAADQPLSEVTILYVDARRPKHEKQLPSVLVSFWEGSEEIAPRMEFTELEFELVGLPEGSYRAILTHPLLKKPVIIDRFEVTRAVTVEIVLR